MAYSAFSLTTPNGYMYTSEYAWATVKAMASSDFADSGVIGSHFAAQTVSGWYALSRGLITFNTAALPDTAILDQGYVADYATFYYANHHGGDFRRHFLTAPNSAAVVQVADYDLLGDDGAALSSSVASPYDGWSQYNIQLQLNSSGLSHISKTGNTKFGVIVGMDLYDAGASNWYSGETAHMELVAPELRLWWHYPPITVTPSLLGGAGGFLTPTVEMGARIITPALLAEPGGFFAPSLVKTLLRIPIFGEGGGTLTPSIVRSHIKPSLFGASGGVLTPNVGITGNLRAGGSVLPDEYYLSDKDDNTDVRFSLYLPGGDPINLTLANSVTAHFLDTDATPITSASCTVNDASEGKVVFNAPASTLGTGSYIVMFKIDWGFGKYSVLPESGQISRIHIRESKV